MLKSEAVVWSVLFIIEAFVIVMGNLFSIVKFAGSGQHLKCSSYLLINLASADIVVGACAVPTFVYLIGGQGQLWCFSYKPGTDIFTAMDVFSGLASILSLTLVSLERLSATLWPLNHRLLNTRVYILAIATAWFVSCAATVTGMIMRQASPPATFLFYISVVILSVSCITVLSRI